MAKEFPQIKKKDQGKFTAWAKRNGFKDACSAASAVMKSKKKIFTICGQNGQLCQ